MHIDIYTYVYFSILHTLIIEQRRCYEMHSVKVKIFSIHTPYVSSSDSGAYSAESGAYSSESGAYSSESVGSTSSFHLIFPTYNNISCKRSVINEMA